MDGLGTNKKRPRTVAKENYGESVVHARHRIETEDRNPENDETRVNGERVRTDQEDHFWEIF